MADWSLANLVDDTMLPPRNPTGDDDEEEEDEERNDRPPGVRARTRRIARSRSTKPYRGLGWISALPADSTVVVVLDSPGGSLGEGIAVGKFFHRANIISFVGLMPS